MEQKAEFIKKWKPIPAGYNGQWDEMESDLDTLLKEVAEAQRNRDRAVYSINRTKTSIEIRDAMLKAPLVTHSATRRAAK